MGFSTLPSEQATAFHGTCRNLLNSDYFQLPLGCGSWIDLFPPAFIICHYRGMFQKANLAANCQFG